MSMGPGSYGVSPIRNSERIEEPLETLPATLEAEPADFSLPTYVAIGGGLSNRRLVKKMPEEIEGSAPKDLSLVAIMRYMTAPELQDSDVDRTVVDAVRERMELADCRVLVNNPAGLGTPYNLGKEHLEDSLQGYLILKDQQTGSGAIQVNFCDVTIITHDEGGKQKYQTLEQRIPR